MDSPGVSAELGKPGKTRAFLWGQGAEALRRVRARRAGAGDQHGRGLPKAMLNPWIFITVAWGSKAHVAAEQAWGKSLLAALETEVRAHPGEQGCQAAGFPSPCDRPALTAGVSQLG